jgi:hypothetical protein
MPVIECSCGMVMSVSDAEPRRNCIRCRGIEFRVLHGSKPANQALERWTGAPFTIGNASPLALSQVGRSVTDSPVAGCFMWAVESRLSDLEIC